MPRFCSSLCASSFSNLLAIFIILVVAPFVFAETAQPEPSFVLIDDFEDSELGGLPSNWEWKDSDDDEEKPYSVEKQHHNRYLAGRDHGQSVILAKPNPVNITKYPYLSFRWRIHQLPDGGDERYGATNDSAAAVYIIYKKKMGLIPVSIKYVWSTMLPTGTGTQRSGLGRPWNIVADSGTDGLGKWHTHVFDVRAAYRETFGGTPPTNIIGVAILSDANATGSTAYADYDDIAFLSSADADSGVRKVVDAE